MAVLLSLEPKHEEEHSLGQMSAWSMNMLPEEGEATYTTPMYEMSDFDAADGSDPLSEAHLASTSMIEFLFGSTATENEANQLRGWEGQSSPDMTPPTTTPVNILPRRHNSAGNWDTFDASFGMPSKLDGMSDADLLSNSQYFSPNIWTAPQLSLSRHHSAPSEISELAAASALSFHQDSYAIPQQNYNDYFQQLWGSSTSLAPNASIFTPQVQNSCNFTPQSTQVPQSAKWVPTTNKSRRSSNANARFTGKTFDIDSGLCLPEIEAMPFVNNRKIVSFTSTRTHRSTVVSILDPKYLQPELQDLENEFGFLSFHDCVELRMLKTGENITRNQRNNLRKRLVATARKVIQVDVVQVLKDFSEPDCCPRSINHHTKLNAYLISPTVCQVLLCTRKNDPVDCYSGQSLAVQTLFDMCKTDTPMNVLAEFILSKPGIDLNTRNFKGMCPIHYASKGGYKNAIQVLLDHNADVNVKDKSNQTALHYAIYNGHRDIQFLLLSVGAAVDTCNISGNTLLHVAAYHNQTEVADAIIKRCPNLKNVRNHKFNSTPLKCAAYKGLTDMVRLLSAST